MHRKFSMSERATEPFPFPVGRSWDGRPVSDSAVLHPHIDIAQKHWGKLLKPGDIVMDATTGNGHDTLNLVRQISWFGGGILIACDIQPFAIDSSKGLLREQLDMTIHEENATRWTCIPNNLDRREAGSVILNWNVGCHLDLMKGQMPSTVKLVVFNLGYLPGGNKSITTLSSVTIATLQEATEVLEPGGCVSITCYPGHEEGEAEQQAVVSFAAALPQQRFSCYWHQWINQRNKRTGKPAPSLVLIQRL